MTISECVSPPVGLVESLRGFACGPVGLVHMSRVGIKYKKPSRPRPMEFSYWAVHAGIHAAKCQDRTLINRQYKRSAQMFRSWHPEANTRAFVEIANRTRAPKRSNFHRSK